MVSVIPIVSPVDAWESKYLFKEKWLLWLVETKLYVVEILPNGASKSTPIQNCENFLLFFE